MTMNSIKEDLISMFLGVCIGVFTGAGIGMNITTSSAETQLEFLAQTIQEQQQEAERKAIKDELVRLLAPMLGCQHTVKCEPGGSCSGRAVAVGESP